MTNEILDPATCPHCGQNAPAPVDGRWRWARGGKVHQSLEVAEMRCRDLERQGRPFEYRAALDDQGNPRIATRRKAATE